MVSWKETRLITINEERCKGCELCVVCPNDLIQMSDRFNVKGYRVPEVVNPEDCTGCGVCYSMCPDVAIELED